MTLNCCKKNEFNRSRQSGNIKESINLTGPEILGDNQDC